MIATAHHCIIFAAGIIGVTVAALTPPPFPLEPVAASNAAAVVTTPNAFTRPTRAEIADFAARCPQFTA